MKRSPLNNAAHGGRPYGARHTPHNWKSHENAIGRGYQPAETNSYQRFSVSGAGPRPYDDNFIPLNVSTPNVMTRHEKYNTANQYRSASGRSPGGGWYNNYRGNYHATPRSNCNRYPAYKHSSKQFHGQKRKDYKGAHGQANVSAYIDMNSFLEDPWEHLVKKLNDSRDMSKSEGPENESLSNSKLTDSDSTEIFGSKLLKNTNLEDSQCSSQECKSERSVDTNFEMQNIELSQISKVNSSESKIGDICSSQDSLNESTCSVNDKICGAIQEKNIHLSSLLDTDQKDI